VQGMKKGIMEVADIVVVNKADGDMVAAAKVTQADYANAMRLLQFKGDHGEPMVLTCSAYTGEGIAEVAKTVRTVWQQCKASGELEQKRGAQRRQAMRRLVNDLLLSRLQMAPHLKQLAHTLEQRVLSGAYTPRSAAETLVDAFLVHPPASSSTP